MKKEQKEGIFVVSKNTHHYNSAPSGKTYTFMKGRGLWINNPLDIVFFKGKVERGSGFLIEKEAINIADKVKVVKKEAVEEAPLTTKIKEKLTGKKTPKENKDPKAEAIKAASEEKLKKALEVLEALDEKEAKEKEAVEADLPEEIAALVEDDEEEEVAE